MLQSIPFAPPAVRVPPGVRIPPPGVLTARGDAADIAAARGLPPNAPAIPPERGVPPEKDRETDGVGILRSRPPGGPGSERTRGVGIEPAGGFGEVDGVGG